MFMFAAGGAPVLATCATVEAALWPERYDSLIAAAAQFSSVLVVLAAAVIAYRGAMKQISAADQRQATLLEEDRERELTRDLAEQRTLLNGLIAELTAQRVRMARSLMLIERNVNRGQGLPDKNFVLELQAPTAIVYEANAHRLGILRWDVIVEAIDAHATVDAWNTIVRTTTLIKETVTVEAASSLHESGVKLLRQFDERIDRLTEASKQQ